MFNTMTNNYILWTIEDKIKIIKDFSPEDKPIFEDNEHAMRYFIWSLYERVYEALKSFMILLDNKRYYDAFIIAGHALETCAILSYIKDNENEKKQQKNYNKYLARSAVGRLLEILETDEMLEKDISWNAYEVVLKMFYPVGNTIIKNIKTNNKDANERHEDVIEILKSRKRNNAEKIKIIRDSYQRPDSSGYITSFSKRFGNFDDGAFKQYYTKYCEFKHSNLLSPGAIKGDLDAYDIDWHLDLIIGILLYLKKSKLSPADQNLFNI